MHVRVLSRYDHPTQPGAFVHSWKETVAHGGGRMTATFTKLSSLTTYEFALFARIEVMRPHLHAAPAAVGEALVAVALYKRHMRVEAKRLVGH